MKLLESEVFGVFYDAAVGKFYGSVSFTVEDGEDEFIVTVNVAFDGRTDEAYSVVSTRAVETARKIISVSQGG